MNFNKTAPLALAFIALSAGACSEKLESPIGCPELCPGQGVEVINVTIDAVVLDTTVIEPMEFGTESLMLLASRGDTVDSRVIVRFDTLPQRYRASSTDTTTTEITTVDSAFLQLRLDLKERQMAGPLTVDAYDVNAEADDTDGTALLPLFAPDRLIGSRTFAVADLKDSVRIPLSNAAVLAKVRAEARLRIGLRISGNTGQFHVLATESGTGPVLSLRVSADTAIRPLTFTAHTVSPDDSVAAATPLADYRLLVRSPPSGPREALLAGDVPPSRVYMRFIIPASILDSASVLRATLLLTQFPNRGFGPVDTVPVVTQLVIAGRAITDPVQAARIVAPPEFTQVDTLRVAVSDSGVRELDMAPILRVWRAQGDTLGPRAIVLRSARDGVSPPQAWFFATEAAPALRPRLRLSFTPANPFGLP